jgi:hypothetical protein
MKTSHVWYDCFIKELNIQDKYKNIDCYSLRPMRQDLFWVHAEKQEISQLLTRVKDPKHRALIWEKTSTDDKDYFFFISRDGNYIQNYAFLMLNSPGSLWQKFSEVRFDDIKKLEYIVLPEALKRIETFKTIHSIDDYYPGA